MNTTKFSLALDYLLALLLLVAFFAGVGNHSIYIAPKTAAVSSPPIQAVTKTVGIDDGIVSDAELHERGVLVTILDLGNDRHGVFNGRIRDTIPIAANPADRPLYVDTTGNYTVNNELEAGDSSTIINQHLENNENAPTFEILSVGQTGDPDKLPINDLALSELYLDSENSDGETVRLVVCAENRGTEKLSEIILTVKIDTLENSYGFTDVMVGETVSKHILVGIEHIQAKHEVTIQSSATIVGGNDARPENNRKTSTITYLGTKSGDS